LKRITSGLSSQTSERITNITSLLAFSISSSTIYILLITWLFDCWRKKKKRKEKKKKNTISCAKFFPPL